MYKRQVFSFETSDETAYFDKWYSSAFMTKGLLAKEKYKFVDALKNAVDVPTVLLSELTDIEGAYIPNDVSKQAKRPCKIFIDEMCIRDRAYASGVGVAVSPRILASLK